MLSIIYESDLHSIDIQRAIYKIPIYFFSKYEKNALLSIQELLEDPSNWFETIYKPKNNNDTFRFVYEGRKPAYHNSPNCDRLLSDFRNFEIPQIIRDKGNEEVVKFRNWFEKVEHLLHKDPDAFVMRLNNAWGLKTNVKAIQYENSGSVEFLNMDLKKLEGQIDSLIKDAGRFYYKCDKNTKILRSFSRKSSLAYLKDPIYKNNTGYSDKELKMFLKHYHETFKKPLREKLIQYYKVKLNPDIKMEGKILNRLGFKICNKCQQQKLNNFNTNKSHSSESFYASI